jgi:hypothetical protein
LILDQQRLQNLPEDGPIIPVVIEGRGDLIDQIQGIVDLGPAAAQHEEILIPAPTAQQEPVLDEAVNLNLDEAGIDRAMTKEAGFWPLEHHALLDEGGGSELRNTIEADLAALAREFSTYSDPAIPMDSDVPPIVGVIDPSPPSPVAEMDIDVPPIVGVIDPSPPSPVAENTEDHMVIDPAPTVPLNHSDRFVQPFVTQIPLNPANVMYFWLYAFPTLFMPSYIVDGNGNVAKGPMGMCVSTNNVLYICDTFNHVIKMIQNGVMTMAGGAYPQGTWNLNSYGPATSVTLNNPGNCVYYNAGNILFFISSESLLILPPD